MIGKRAAVIVTVLTGRMACYQSAQGAKDACASIDRADEAGGGAVITARAGALGPRQTLTMAVGFAPETFVPFDASYLASPFGWLQAVAGVAALARRRGLT